jgi:hypothetical protein
MLADMHPPTAPAVDTTDAIAIIHRASQRKARPDANPVFGGFRLIAQPAGTGTNDRGNSGPGRTGVPKDPPTPGASPGSGGTPDSTKKAPDEPTRKKRARGHKAGDTTGGGGATGDAGG